jgi:hypothetical protein
MLASAIRKRGCKLPMLPLLRAPFRPSPKQKNDQDLQDLQD